MDTKENLFSDEKTKLRMDCIVKGIEVEKEPEFKEEMTNPKEEVLVEKEILEPIKFDYEIPKRIIEKVEEEKEENLTKTQEVLVEFIDSKIKEGFELIQIERLLEKGLIEKEYSESDYLKSINYVIEKKLNFKIKETSKRETVYIKEKPKLDSIDLKQLINEEKEFVLYLLDNLNHENSTVELYKLIGLSARKGNVIKNELLKKGLIKIEEIRYNKGWKKLIRLNNHIPKNLNHSEKFLIN